ncbi:hypothetical protein HPB50_003987 [Hyalomma asiaticum]|uniref:Uncharacterized protein n=1 Tax=Hyalomma asiaticum TaxID=266040 RepID=A0ACB7TE96_HYAAI|nr:hypothetical protein HPB50_003987 [Hyalomma asiaticum]
MSHVEKTFHSLRDATIAKQFLSSCFSLLRVFLKQRSCQVHDTLAKNAKCSLEAENITNLGREKLTKESMPEPSHKDDPPKMAPRTSNLCFLCDRTVHRASECWTQTTENSTGHGMSS